MPLPGDRCRASLIQVLLEENWPNKQIFASAHFAKNLHPFSLKKEHTMHYWTPSWELGTLCQKSWHNIQSSNLTDGWMDDRCIYLVTAAVRIWYTFFWEKSDPISGILHLRILRKTFIRSHSNRNALYNIGRLRINFAHFVRKVDIAERAVRQNSLPTDVKYSSIFWWDKAETL